ncbi:MAG: tRNA (guanosine(46)-N7)-methyltransferase TrmB, partial [Campylobacterota bacterium]|nr:tRNA (guanosine(46)-N7)-methyltransferase TrmB [Campylobacterota bacterium]
LNINKNREIAISSKYEDRWKKMEKNIYDLTMINEESSQPLSLEGSFEFTQHGLNYEKLLALHGTTSKFNNGFIHFERAYILESGIMLRLSMGSFDRPEHLYLVIKDDSSFYYPALPLKSKSNLIAHKFLDEVLNG